MQATDGDGVFIADLSAESARLGEANVVSFTGRPAAHNARLQGDELAVLLVAQAYGLRRNRAAAQFCRAGQGDWSCGGVFHRSKESRPDERSGFQRRGADRGHSSRAPDASIVASLSRKPASTRSASASISVFLAPRFSWTQPAAWSADWSLTMSAIIWSRNAADGSGPRMVRAGLAGFSVRRGAFAPGGVAWAVVGWRSVAARAALLRAPSLPPASAFAPSARSGASGQGIASCVGERRSHPARRRGVGDRADGPFRRQPLPGRMGERGGQADEPCLVIDHGRFAWSVAISRHPGILRIQIKLASKSKRVTAPFQSRGVCRSTPSG